MQSPARGPALLGDAAADPVAVLVPVREPREDVQHRAREGHGHHLRLRLLHVEGQRDLGALVLVSPVLLAP